MPQSLNLSSILTIKEMLEFYAKIYGASEKKFKEMFSLLNELLDFPPSDQLIGTLSGGEKRRISLAAAFIHDPSLILLDEPTVGLDHFLRMKIWNFFRHQVKTFGTTIILSTHYTYEASICDRIGIIKEGKMIVEASPKFIMDSLGRESLNDAIFELFTENREIKENIEKEENFEETKHEKLNFWDLEKFYGLIKHNFILMKRSIV